jgi:hypothetical protein
MRTTVRLDDSLLAQAKQEALRSGRTLTGVIADALRESLGRRAKWESQREKADLPTFAGDGLLPGVDLDHTSSLLDLMERDGPR